MRISPIVLVTALILSSTAVAASETDVGSVTVGPQVGTATHGSDGSVTFKVTVQRGGPGHSSVSAKMSVTSTLPPGATASFSPDLMSIGDGAATTTLTIRTVGSTNAGVTAVTVRAEDTRNNNKRLRASGSCQVKVDQGALTVSATALNKVYDGNASATVTLSDNRSGGDVLTVTYASATFGDKMVGSNKQVTVSGISITGPDADDYTVNTTASTTADITALPFTVTATGVDKVYDGTTAATVTLSDNRLAGDVITVNYASALFANKHVGSAKAINVTGINVTGPDAGNYAYKTDASTAADITPRGLNVRFTGGNKVYDGKTLATVTPSDDRVSGDNLTVTYVSALFADKKVGSAKPVTVTGINVTGPDAGNYAYKTDASTAADITCRSLTVLFSGGNKVYDGKILATLTPSDDRVGGDVLTISYTSATFADKKIGTAKPVSVTGITITGPDAGNYCLVNGVTTAANITPLSLNVRFTGGNKVYDGKLLATVTPGDDRVAGDVLTVTYASALFANKHVASAKPVTVTGINVTGPDAGNYAYKTDATTAADITPRSLNVTFSGGNKVYDAKILATVTPGDDRVSGDDLTVHYVSALFANKHVGSAKPVTVTGINVTGPDAGNYAYKTDATTAADITYRSLIVTFSGANKVYDAKTLAAVKPSDDRVAGDVLTVNYVSALFANKHVGSAKVVTVTGISVAGPDAGNYAYKNEGTTAADITPRNLTVLFSGGNKIYDAKNLATVTPSDDRVTGDDLTVTYVSALFANKHVGSAKAVTVTGIAVTGPDAGNYAYKNEVSTAADITPRILTVLFTAGNKVYDGTIAATVTPSDDRVQGDGLTVSYGSATFGDEKVGTAKPVTVTGITVTGPDAGNYAPSSAASTTDVLMRGISTAGVGNHTASGTATATANITPRSLIVRFTGGNKVYDGKTLAAVTPGDDRVAGDVLTVNYVSALFADKHVGSAKAVSVTGISVTGPDAGNYAYKTDATTAADITYRSLNVTFSGGNKVYDAKTLATVTPGDDRVSGDDLTVTYTSALFANKHVGSAKAVTVTGISVAGPDARNYAYKHDASTAADITYRSLIVTFSGANKVYDGKTLATVTPSDDRAANDVLTVTYGSALFANKHVGSAKAVTVTGISVAGPDAGNYAYKTDATTAADITYRSLNVRFSGGNKVYDGNQGAAVTPSDDRVSNDVLTVTYASALFANKHVGSAKAVSVTGISVTGPDASNYAYKTDASTAADITPRNLNVLFYGLDRVYDGTTAATVTRSDDRVSGDQLTITYAIPTFDNKKVGTAKRVTVTGINVTGFDAGNYAYKNEASTTANITPLSLIVIFRGVNRVYDGSTAATVTHSEPNLVTNDVLTVNYGSAFFDDRHVGLDKRVTVTGITITGGDAGNYTYSSSATFADNKMGTAKPVGDTDAPRTASSTASTTANITSRSLNVWFTGGNKVYDANEGAEVTPGDDRVSRDVLTVRYTSAKFANKKVGTAKTVSVTGITVQGPDAGNYAYKPEANTAADITPRSLNVWFTGGNKVYNGDKGADVTPGDDRVSGDVLTVRYDSATFADKKVGTARLVTVTRITVEGPDADNYAYKNEASTSADITRRPLTVTPQGGAKVYDGTTAFPLGGVPPGDDRVAGDVFTVHFSSASFDDKKVGTAKPVAVRGIWIAGPDADNYAVSSTAYTTADITPRLLTVTLSGTNRIYDGTTTAQVTILRDDRVPGDVLTVHYVDASFADKKVATAKVVTVNGPSIDGTDAGNYTLGPLTTTADITAFHLTVTWTGLPKDYDGTTSAKVETPPVDDRVGGDLFAVENDPPFFADANAGTAKPVTVPRIRLTGNDAPNYATPATGSTTADIRFVITTSYPVSPSALTAQYSDLVTYEASLSPASVTAGQKPATAVTFYVGTQAIGNATLVDQGGVLKGTLAAPLLESTPSTGQLAPGSHSVTAVFNGVNPNFIVNNPDAGTLNITQEDARAAYSGGLLTTTSSTSTGRATVTLRATIRDISATSEAAGDASPGDIRNATVTFIDRDNGGAVIGTAPVGLVSAADSRTGTVTVHWPVDIGSADTKTFTVGIVVGNYYTRNSSDDITLVTVAKPLNRLVTGGGVLALSNSSGIYASPVGALNNFGFGVTYGSDEDNPRGNVNTIVRSGGHVYQLKGSSLSSFSVQKTSAGGTSSFKGKGSIVDITDPLVPLSVEPSATVQVSLEDLGEPGTSDLIALSVSNKSGTLLFSSNWDGTKTVKQVLAAGNLQVRGSKSSSAPTVALLKSPPETAGGPIPIAYAFPQNFPNPFRESTNLRFELPERSQVTLTVYDVSGREVASLVNREIEPGFHVTAWSGRSQEGRPLGAGVYFVRMTARSLTGTGGLRADRRVVLVR